MREPEHVPEALEELRRETAQIDRREGYRKEYVPKPRGVRRYERLSSMGDRDGE